MNCPKWFYLVIILALYPQVIKGVQYIIHDVQWIIQRLGG